jgi:hypothetical protein
MFPSMKPESVVLLLLLGALCLAGPAAADDASAGPDAGTAVFDTPTPSGIPVEQELQLRTLLAPMLNRSDEGLVTVVDPDGGISMDPQGRFQTVVLARIGEDGKLQIYSFDELEPALGFLTFEIPTPEPPAGTTAAD